MLCQGDDSGSDVMLNGKFKGNCPVDIQVAEDTYKLLAKMKWYFLQLFFDQNIRVGAGEVYKIRAFLYRKLNVSGLKMQKYKEAKHIQNRQKQSVTSPILWVGAGWHGCR